MTLSDKQQKFTYYVGELIKWAYTNGYGLTFGEAYRTPEQAEIYASQGKGIRDSLHCKRLAVDFNLFINGEYQTDTEAYKPLGIKWEEMDPNNRWGGKFSNRPDGNHFEYNG